MTFFNFNGRWPAKVSAGTSSDEIFGVKWRGWSLHFRGQDGWNTALRTYTLPRIYKLTGLNNHH